jgi:hypothetical protein
MTIMAPASSSLSWKSWTGLGLLSAALAWFWILPIWNPRGPYLWGHYRFTDVYAGLPVALVTFCVALVLFAPVRSRRPLALRLSVMCVALIVSLAVVDLIYSLVVVGAWRSDYWLDLAHIERRYSVSDAELGFVRKPLIQWRGRNPSVGRIVEYRSDEHGFRNPPGLNRADIAFIGDSYTEAGSVEVPKTFPQRVADEMKITAVNLGRGAYGPQQELIVLERYGLSYQPRVVVWQLFEGNDLADAHNYARWRRNPPPPQKPLLSRYLNNSLLRATLGMTWMPDKSGYPQAKLRYHDGAAAIMPIRYSYYPHEPQEEPLGFEETKTAIEAGHRLCQARGIRLVIVYVPVMARVMEPWLDFASAADRERVFPEGKVSSPLDFGNQLASFCRQLGCTYLDLFTALRSAAATDNRTLYIPNDEHLDTGGHQVVAQAVRQLLAGVE